MYCKQIARIIFVTLNITYQIDCHVTLTYLNILIYSCPLRCFKEIHESFGKLEEEGI